MAFILSIKFVFLQLGSAEALVAAGEAAVSHNPHIAYYYHALSLTDDPREGLRACKSGLACTDATMTPYVRALLLKRAVQHATADAMITIHGQLPGSAHYQEAVAMLHSALEDAKTFISEIAPDNKHMAGVLQYFLLLVFTLRGHELSLDLHEIKVRE